MCVMCVGGGGDTHWGDSLHTVVRCRWCTVQEASVVNLESRQRTGVGCSSSCLAAAAGRGRRELGSKTTAAVNV